MSRQAQRHAQAARASALRPACPSARKRLGPAKPTQAGKPGAGCGTQARLQHPLALGLVLAGPRVGCRAPALRIHAASPRQAHPPCARPKLSLMLLSLHEYADSTGHQRLREVACTSTRTAAVRPSTAPGLGPAGGPRHGPSAVKLAGHRQRAGLRCITRSPPRGVFTVGRSRWSDEAAPVAASRPPSVRPAW